MMTEHPASAKRSLSAPINICTPSAPSRRFHQTHKRLFSIELLKTTPGSVPGPPWPLTSSSRYPWPRTINTPSPDPTDDHVASPVSTTFRVSASISARSFAISVRTDSSASGSVRPATWDEKKLLASVRLEEGMPTGKSMTPVFNQPVLAHDHDQRTTGTNADELYMFQRRILLRRHNQSGAMRQTGQHRRRFFQNLIQRAACGRALIFNIPLLILGQIADFEDSLDKKLKPGIGRQSPRRGMRRIKQAGFFKIRHDIADCCRRQGNTELLRKRPRTNRFAPFPHTPLQQGAGLLANADSDLVS